MNPIRVSGRLLISLLLIPHAVLAQDNPPPAGEQAAQTDGQTIEELIVQASRLDQTRYEMGTSVHIITADQLNRLGYDFVIDAIAGAPGVTINQNGPLGGAASVRVRGAGSEQTLVLVDGVPVNDPSSPGGGFNFARLDPENVERIEILRGPQSTLWGTDAIGGVVSITTKRPQPGLGGNVFYEYGSFDTHRGGVELSAANSTGDVRLGVQRNDSHGISKADEDNGNREEDGYEGTSINLHGNINLPRDAYLNVSVISTDAEAEFDSFSSGAQGNVGDGDEVSKTDELSSQLSLFVPLLDGRLENTLTAGYTEIERENFTDGLPSFAADGERWIYRYHGRFQVNSNHRFGFGLEREDTEARDNENTIDGLYALYEFRPLDALTLTFGARSDDIDGFGSKTTGRFAAAYQLSDNLTLRGTWGEGFKAPTIFQNTFFCCGAAAANTDLQPEESDAYDVGVDWRSGTGRSYASATYFAQDTTNLITFSFAAGGYENIAETESKGVELTLGHEINRWLRVDAAYSYIDATDNNGDQLVRVPEHSGDLQLGITPNERLNVTLLARYNGEERDPNGEVADWWRVDLAANYQLADQLELFARVENLLDEEYQQIIGYGTPGLSVSGGMRLRF